MARTELTLLPTYDAELEEIRTNGISPALLYKIIQKHQPNAIYNKQLYKRYMGLYGGVPIFEREARYEEENPINNKVNTDLMGVVIDFKTGYFAGKPIVYGYSETDEAEETTGGETAVNEAVKVITDFVTRNNMYGVDQTTTKYSAIYGYAGRLFFVDKEGNERVKAVHGYETIILSDIGISEPEYAIRYFQTTDINDAPYWNVDFYDNKYMYSYKGDLMSLELVEIKEHNFDYCPLQGMPNNDECLGDAEKAIAQMDAYDKVLSDNINEIESFAHAYLIFEGMHIDDGEIEKGQKTGAFNFPAMGTQQGKAYYLTKNINDNFTEHNLERLEENIYHTTCTPNLKDATFGTASGEALKFKLHGLETKCGAYQAQVMKAMQYMWKLLASAWSKKGIKVDPLQCTADFTRNFPLSTLSNAQAAQALIAAGIPKKVSWGIAIPEIDDPDYVEEMAIQEKEDNMALFEAAQSMAIKETPDMDLQKEEEKEEPKKEIEE